MRRIQNTWAVSLALCGLAAAPADEASSTARAKVMRDLAGAVVVPARTGKNAERVAEPVYRYDDPARDFSDGTVWAFGKSGRPSALLAITMGKADGGRLYWLHELTSLDPGPIAASSRHASGPWFWGPKEPGLEWKPVPKAPAPADDEPGRLRQLREISRRFKASESLDPARNDPSDRFELRLLPQPVLRYQDPGSGIVDGAVFLMSYGRNPELVTVIEARRDGDGAPTWSYALTRLSAARFRVSLDDEPVADMPKPVYADRTRTYYLFERPVEGL